jgi:hypothetical protein
LSLGELSLSLKTLVCFIYSIPTPPRTVVTIGQFDYSLGINVIEMISTFDGELEARDISYVIVQSLTLPTK